MPVAWYFGNQWPQTFIYRTPLNIVLIVLDVLGLMLVMLLTVSYETFKAAISDPQFFTILVPSTRPLMTSPNPVHPAGNITEIQHSEIAIDLLEDQPLLDRIKKEILSITLSVLMLTVSTTGLGYTFNP